MLFEPRTIPLRDGRTAVFRPSRPADAEPMLDFLKDIASETNFLVRCPEECTETVFQEETWLARMRESADAVYILCEVDGVIAGTCQLNRHTRLRVRHRGAIGLSVRKAYWNLGIGTAMLEALTDFARDMGLFQLELDFSQGNDRARRLYEKAGFVLTGEKPAAIRLEDGTLLSEFSMVKRIS